MSEVLGEELYLVELDGTAKEQDVCECQYWMEHGYCKHTVAVELALKQQACQELFKRIKQSVLRKQIDQQLKCLPKALPIKQSFCRSSLQPLRLEFHLDVIETNNYYPELSTIGLSLKLVWKAPNLKHIL